MRASPARSRERNASRSQTDFSSSGATTLLSTGTVIAVAQIFPTATQKFPPNPLNSGRLPSQKLPRTVGIVRAVDAIQHHGELARPQLQRLRSFFHPRPLEHPSFQAMGMDFP